MHNNLVAADLSPSYPMLCALDDMEAIWTLSFIEGYKKVGNEFNDFCMQSLIVIQFANFLYVQAAHHAYINVKARYDFARKCFLQQELGLVRVQGLLFSFRISIEELLIELFPHWLVLGELYLISSIQTNKTLSGQCHSTLCILLTVHHLPLCKTCDVLLRSLQNLSPYILLWSSVKP